MIAIKYLNFFFLFATEMSFTVVILVLQKKKLWILKNGNQFWSIIPIKNYSKRRKKKFHFFPLFISFNNFCIEYIYYNCLKVALTKHTHSLTVSVNFNNFDISKIIVNKTLKKNSIEN